MASKFLMNQAIADAQDIDKAPASTNFNWSNMFKGFGNYPDPVQDVTYPNKLQNESFSDLSYVDDGTHHPRKAMPIQTRNLNYNIHQDPAVNWRNNNAINYRSTYPEGPHRPNMRDISGEVDEYNGIMATNAAQKKGNFVKNLLDNSMFGTIAAGFDATNPRAFNYNPKLEGQIDYMKANNAYGVIDSSGLNKITRGVLKDKNLQSAFGTNDLGQMLSNQLAKYEKTYANLDKQWGKTLSDEELQAKKARYFKQFIEPARIEEQLQIDAAKKSAAEALAKQRQGTRAADKAAGAFRDTVQLDPGGYGPGGSGTWHGQTAAKERQGVQVAGPGFGKGSYFNQGGRAGYQGGELVTDESMMEATPAGFRQENVEEVQGEPTREELEALAIEIFQLPLEELNEEQLMIVYQAAMQQEPMEEAVQEEDVQYAAQGGLAGLL